MLALLLLCLSIVKVEASVVTYDILPGEKYEIDANGQLVRVIPYQKPTNPIVKEMKKAFFRDIRLGYFYDILRDSPQDRGRLGVSSPMLSYRALSLDPLILYNPNNAHTQTEFATSLSVILLGNRNTQEEIDFVKKSKGKRIIDRMFLGSMILQNFSTGKFGFGIEVGLIF